MEHSITQVARAAGTTSRTLRHYDSIGLLPPSRIAANGYRYYDDAALVRLQRILLLRQLGLGLETIGEVLRGQESTEKVEAQILQEHLELLRQERAHLTAQIKSVERTITALTRAGHTESTNLMAENIFDGFDHTEYREEVDQRWGADAYAKSDRWWRGLSKEEKAEWKNTMEQLGQDWIAAAERREDPTSPVAQALAERHVSWLRSIPGTPAHGDGHGLAGYVLGLGEMYVADDRFAANYGGREGAQLVRDALRHYVETNLQ